MNVRVEAIAFNHGLTIPAYSLPLRLNEQQPVEVPEWTIGTARPSVAAYIRHVLPGTAFVLVRFLIDTPQPTVLQIRAAASNAEHDGTAAGVLLPQLPELTVTFFNGSSGWCAFPFPTSELVAAGVSRSTTRWTWQLRTTLAASWAEFDETLHTIYVVLATPTPPWLLSPATSINPALPWTEVLDVACVWANGATDVVEAAGKVTQAVFDLGPQFLQYDAPIGAPHYTVLGLPRFLCTAFLERIHGGLGAGPLVNCSDCGTIVSTFANILGADLWQSKMGFVAPQFRLNPILAIGSHEWSTVHGSFAFHEVAWSGECTAHDTVYDACLKTDADDDPTTAPQTPQLPINQRFGDVDEPDVYRTQLAAPPDHAICAPAPALRIRRPVSIEALSLGPPLTAAAIRAVSEPLQTFLLAPPARLRNYFFAGFHFFGNEFTGWDLVKSQEYASFDAPSATADRADTMARISPGSRVLVSWWHSLNGEDSLLRVESVDSPSAGDAWNAVLRVAADLELPRLEPFNQLGDAGLRNPEGSLVVLVRGNHVHVVRSAGLAVVDVTQHAVQLDQLLTGAGVPAAISPPTRPVRLPEMAFATGSWLRFESSAPGLTRTRGQLLFAPGVTAAADVAVFVVAPADVEKSKPMLNV